MNTVEEQGFKMDEKKRKVLNVKNCRTNQSNNFFKPTGFDQSDTEKKILKNKFAKISNLNWKEGHNCYITRCHVSLLTY